VAMAALAYYAANNLVGSSLREPVGCYQMYSTTDKPDRRSLRGHS
jgi:hypothetical protein